MKWLLTILLLGSLYGQGFGYNYIDPCNQQAVNLNYSTEATESGFWVTYYNKRAFFTWTQVAEEHYKLGHNKYIKILRSCFLVRLT